MYEDYKEIFEDKKLIVLVDAMAQRYGKLPHEILIHSSIFEFNLNVAIMIQAMSHSNKKEEEGFEGLNNPQGFNKDTKNFNPQKDGKKFGIGYKVKRVKKGEMTDG